MTERLAQILPRRPASEEGLARERIVSAARAHFFTHGFRSVSMDNIAEALAMSKRTLYQHFSSKDELVSAVIRSKYQSIERDFEQILSEHPNDFPSALHGLLALMQSHTEQIHPPFVRDMRRESPELFALSQSLRREVVQKHFGRLLRSGRNSGMIRKDIPVTLMIEMLLGTLEAIVNPEKMMELNLNLNTAFSSIISIFLDGATVRVNEGLQ